MRILLYGGRGWIGQQFTPLLDQEQICYQHGAARVDNVEDTIKEIGEVRPSHVVAFIGRTHGKIDKQIYPTIDYLEQPGKLQENIRDNLFSPVSLALLCKERGIHFTYLGTGCIFSYTDGFVDGFSEDDLPNFFGSSYSTVKGFTDRLMHQLEGVLNLRIRMPISSEDNERNFITKITNYEYICSIPNSMTVLPDLLPVALKMIQGKQTGTINLTNPGAITHNEILEMYKEIVDPGFSWKNFSLEEQDKILASKRSNNLLNTSRLEAYAPSYIKPIKSSVRNLLQNYKYDSKLHNKHMTGDFPDRSSTCLLVTGGAGFIGSNFINQLWKEYTTIRLINIDALYYSGKEEHIDQHIRKDDRYSFIHGNLQSPDLLAYIFRTHPITHIIHFAAQSHVQTSFSDALQYTQDNILGTHNLLEACRKYGSIRKFIHVSTDEVYGESMLNEYKQNDEGSILCPTNPYAATKAGAELIARSYYHSFGIPIVITRGNNVYGPNQHIEKVIPRFISQLKLGEKVTIQGDGSCMRAFMHVSDAANAFSTILKRGRIGEIYNIGCDEQMEYSILDLAKFLIEQIRDTRDYDKWITHIEDRPFNDKRYYISNQKLKNLGWSIKTLFEQGIRDLTK